MYSYSEVAAGDDGGGLARLLVRSVGEGAQDLVEGDGRVATEGGL